MIGQQLGNYRVEEQIGAGGMGVVFRATDTRLRREVAIKILSRDSMGGPLRRSRFEREARLLASLNHPHIGSIYGVEECNGSWCLVLEYVPGPTLADRLAFARLPIKDALEICAAIAEALEAAHGRGIIHRDLKPGNVKITPDGVVKVLDFGLGKATDEAADASGAHAETLTAGATEAGIVLGTAAYMSPEQARGKPVDKRADVWSFGCVLYEALTGRRAFQGETTSDTVALILERDPDWSALPAAVPANVRTLLQRCLQKDARCRLRDLGDAQLELEDALAARTTVEDTRRSRRVYWPAIAAVLALLAVAAGAWAWSESRRPAPNEVIRFVHELPAGQRIPPSWNPSLMFSPDGKSLAFSYAANGVFATVQRRIDELDQKPLTAARSLTVPVFSPDGQSVAMFDSSDGTVKKAAIGGSLTMPLMPADMYGRGDWGADGYIYYTERFPGAIARVGENGGAKEAVTTLDPAKDEFVHRHAQILPGGKAIMFTVVSAGMESYNDARIEVQALATKQRKVLVRGGFGARYSPSGHIVYANGGNLYAVPFDAERLEVSGMPVKVVEGAQMSIDTGATYFDVSRAGTLAYVPGLAQGGARTLVWVDRTGRAETLPLKPHSYLFPRISPDGKTLAVEIEGATHNLYTYDFARGVLTKITTDGVSHAPVWTPDGANLCFRSWKAGTMTMWEMPWDRSRPEQRLTTIGQAQSPVAVSPDGRFLAFNQGSPGTGLDVWVMPLTGEDRTPRPFVRSNFAEGSAKFSPDGKWVTYCSNESGKPQAYVQPWPGPGPITQISTDGGTDPLWSRTGKEIFYRSGDKMMVVAVSTAGALHLGKPAMLWEGHYSPGLSSSCGPPGVSSNNYDVSADGQRFLMVKDADQDNFSTRIVIVVNWVEELRRLFAKK